MVSWNPKFKLIQSEPYISSQSEQWATHVIYEGEPEQDDNLIWRFVESDEMSFLAGRSAAAEGAYFLQESKQAVERLSQKYPSSSSSSPSIPSKTHASEAQTADVLHEVLRHSIPIKPSHHHPQSSLPSLSASSKWRSSSSSSSSSSHPSPSSDALNPLRAYVSMPQVTFGPKRSVVSSLFFLSERPLCVCVFVFVGMG